MKYYEVTSPKFDGSTDKTDHLVLWVGAPDIDTVLAVAKGCVVIPLTHPSVPTTLLDFRLPAQADELAQFLKENA